jgi:hypothetical protein
VGLPDCRDFPGQASNLTIPASLALTDDPSPDSQAVRAMDSTGLLAGVVGIGFAPPQFKSRKGNGAPRPGLFSIGAFAAGASAASRTPLPPRHQTPRRTLPINLSRVSRAYWKAVAYVLNV